MAEQNPLNLVTTPSEIEKTYNLSAGTVRQYFKRHAKSLIERGELRKVDNRTWLMLKATAHEIWGNKG